MKRRDWLLVVASLLITWGIDRITKIWAEGLHGIQFHGPLGFVLYHNRGAMLGLFSNLPAILRVVSLSTGGAFLLFSFIIIQYILPLKSLPLRVGMSILLGGILGNVTDRIIYGFVVDFILIGSPETSSPAFNMGDALQWVGYGIIVWSLIREGELLWPAANSRNLRWVNLKFQLRYCFVLMGVGAGLSIIAGVYSYTFLRVTILDLVGNNPKILNQYLTPFVFTFLIVTVGFGVILFLTGRVLSQRIAGPLYAFEKFLDELMQGNARPLRLRTGDEFKHLEELAARISAELLKRQSVASANEKALENVHKAEVASGETTPTTKASSD